MVGTAVPSGPLSYPTLTALVAGPFRRTVIVAALVPSLTLYAAWWNWKLTASSTMVTVAVDTPSATPPLGCRSVTTSVRGPCGPGGLRRVRAIGWLRTPAPNVSGPFTGSPKSRP